MCADIGVPMAEEKTFLPTQVLSFLGYELDSVKMEVRVPSDKLEKCLSLIQEFLTKPKFTLKTLQSIIGTLNFACAVVLPGRAFLRRLIDLTIGVSKPHYFIRITKEVREDLHMWAEFLANFNHLHGRTMVVVNQPEPVHRRIWNPWLRGSAGLILVLRSMVSAVGQSEYNTAGALLHCFGCADMGQQASQ